MNIIQLNTSIIFLVLISCTANVFSNPIENRFLPKIIDPDTTDTKSSEDLIETVSNLNTRLAELEKKNKSKTFRFGISVGYREVKAKEADEYQSPSISTKDSTLQLQVLDPGSFVISTSMIVTPWRNADWVQDRIDYLKNISQDTVLKKNGTKVLRKKGGLKKVGLQCLSNIGFHANLNLIEFNPQETKFNQTVEGGLGISYRLSDNVYFSVQHEIVFSRQLREQYKAMVGQKIYDINGNVITDIKQIDENDNNYYITTSFLAWVFPRLVITF